MTRPLLVVDAANVVGSVPDGWWRDRAGAAIRLRDRLVDITSAGLADLPGPLEIVIVVEGKARHIPQTPGVRVESAPASGDDAIVALVAAENTAAQNAAALNVAAQNAAAENAAAENVAAGGERRRVVVVTADRELRRRVTELGAEVRGPSSIPR